jgi:uncharacterized sulfatase
MRTLIALSALLIALVWPPLVVAVGPDRSQPNILWLVAEDMSPDLGCYGTDQIDTPHLDRLANRGMRFNKAYATAPTCAPSRSAFNTGMYQTTIGAHHQRLPDHLKPRLPDGVRTIGTRLREAGYQTGNLTQFSNVAGVSGKNDYGFQTRKTPFDTNRWKDLVAEKPFYAQINFGDTHRPFPEPTEIDPDAVKLPPYYPDHPVTRESWAGYLQSIVELDDKVGKVLNHLEKQGLAKNTVIFFFSDHGRPFLRGKQWCYESGLHVPLLVYWPKQADPPKQYTRASTNNELVSLIDVTATTLHSAGQAIPETMQGRPLFQSGVKEREFVFSAADRDGECRLRMRTVTDGQYRYIRNGFPNRRAIYATAYRKQMHPLYHLMKKLGREDRLNAIQQRVIEQRGAEELYNLNNDPWQVHNLAGETRLNKTLRQLRLRTRRWIRRSDDRGQRTDSLPVIKYFYKYGRRSAKQRQGAIQNLRESVHRRDEQFLASQD